MGLAVKEDPRVEGIGVQGCKGPGVRVNGFGV